VAHLQIEPVDVWRKNLVTLPKLIWPARRVDVCQSPRPDDTRGVGEVSQYNPHISMGSELSANPVVTRRTCRQVLRDGAHCKRPISSRTDLCWQHERGLLHRLRSLPRRQAITFWSSLGLAVMGILLTVYFGLFGSTPSIAIFPTVSTPPISPRPASVSISPQPVIRETAFSTSIPVTENEEQVVPVYTPVALGDHHQFFYALVGQIAKDTIGPGAKESDSGRPNNGDETSDFFSEMLRYLLLRWVNDLDSDASEIEWQYNLGYRSSFRPGLAVPDSTLYKRKKLTDLLESNRFSRLTNENKYWSDKRLKVPLHSKVLFWSEESKEHVPTFHLTIENKGKYSMVFSVSRGTRIDNYGFVPQNFVVAPEKLSRTKTYQVMTRFRFTYWPKSAAENSVEEPYTKWANDLVAGLKAAMEH